MKKYVLLLGVAVAIMPLSATAQSARERAKWTAWCESQGGYVQVTASNPICVVPPRRASVIYDGPDPAELERERIRKEKIQKAADADRMGLAAASRGDYETAIGFFLTALGHTPDDKSIREHLLSAQTNLSAVRSAQEMAAVRERIEASIFALEMGACRERLEVEVSVRQQKGLNEGFAGQNARDPKGGSLPTPKLPRRPPSPTRRYSFSATPIADNTPPGKVLISNQARIATVELEIGQAQKALRDLIKINSQSEEQRLEWTKQSEEATIAAEDLAINLVLDLADELVDDQIDINKAEQSQLIEYILNRTSSSGVGAHTVYGSLLNQLEKFKERKQWIRSAKKNNDLQAKIREFRMDDTEITMQKVGEAAYDIITSFEKGDKAFGPYKNLIDAAYVIYKQAASFEILAITLNNQERTYEASKKLQQLISKLVAEKKSLKSATRSRR